MPFDEEELDPHGECRAEIVRLQKIISAAGGYLMNAKIDLETNATKRTAIRTIEGGIKMIEAAARQETPAAQVETPLNIHEGAKP